MVRGENCATETVCVCFGRESNQAIRTCEDTNMKAACKQCGYSLQGLFGPEDAVARCPECGGEQRVNTGCRMASLPHSPSAWRVAWWAVRPAVLACNVCFAAMLVMVRYSGAFTGVVLVMLGAVVGASCLVGPVAAYAVLKAKYDVSKAPESLADSVLFGGWGLNAALGAAYLGLAMKVLPPLFDAR